MIAGKRVVVPFLTFRSALMRTPTIKSIPSGRGLNETPLTLNLKKGTLKLELNLAGRIKPFWKNRQTWPCHDARNAMLSIGLTPMAIQPRGDPKGKSFNTCDPPLKNSFCPLHSHVGGSSALNKMNIPAAENVVRVLRAPTLFALPLKLRTNVAARVVHTLCSVRNKLVMNRFPFATNWKDETVRLSCHVSAPSIRGMFSKAIGSHGSPWLPGFGIHCLLPPAMGAPEVKLFKGRVLSVPKKEVGGSSTPLLPLFPKSTSGRADN